MQSVIGHKSYHTPINVMILGLATGFILAFGHWIFDMGLDPLGEPRKFSWMWIIPCSAVVTFVAAAIIHGLCSVLAPSRNGR